MKIDENMKKPYSRVSFSRGRGKREENMTKYSSSQIGEIRRENFPSPPPVK
ncbi:hypothetical protein Hanom_Chr06g00537301 [Helianthus anomalus]